MAEQPALNRFYVASYAANDKDFPILAVRLDPRVAGYRVPEDLSPHPDSKRYPNHVFTGSQPSNGDERVTHIYEILPSPYVPFTRYDDDLGPIQGRRRSVKNEGQVASLAADKRVTYEAREGSAIVYTEIEESWSIKVDEDGNSLFPVRDRDFYDASRGPVQERRQLFVPTGEEEGSLENVNGVITQTSYEPYNEFLSVKIVQTYSVDGPQLIGKATDNDGQLVTVTTQRRGASGYIPPNPTATRTVEVSREDAESLVERIVDTPEIFTAKTFSLERPDPIPQKFRVAVPLQSNQAVVVGEAQLPNLLTGEISRTEEQRNKFLKRTTATSRNQTVLPKTLIQKATDNDRQEVTITETLQFGDTNEVATATTTVESEALGDGNFVIRKTQIPEVFSAETFRNVKEDLTPQKFRGAQQSETFEENVAGIAQSPVLASGEFEKTEQQVNKFVKRVSTTSRDISSAINISEFVLTPQGQIGSRTLTLASGPQSFVPSATLIDANVESLGDGRTVKTETRVPNVFPNKTIRKSKIDLTPEKFKAKQEDTTTEETVAGTVATNISLAAGEFSKSEEQVTEFVKRISTTERDITASTDIVEFVVTPQGQLATRTLRLSSVAQTIQPSAKLIDGSIEALGDGRTVKTETKIDKVFDSKTTSSTKPETIPEKFRVNAPVKRSEEIIEKENVEDQELSGNELSKTEQRLTEFTVQKTTVEREDVFNETENQRLEENWGIQIPYREYISNSIPSGDNYEGEGLDDKNHLVREYDKTELNSTLSSFNITYPTSIDLDLPRILKDVSVNWEEAKSSSSNQTENPSLSGAFKSLTQQDGGRIQSTLSLTPSVTVEFEDVWGKNLPASMHMFFLEKGNLNNSAIRSKIGASADWPVFKPKSFYTTIVGKTETKSIEASVSRALQINDTSEEYGYVPSKSISESSSIQLNPISINIPPCLTGGKNINETRTLNADPLNIEIAYELININVSYGTIPLPEVRIDQPLNHTLQCSVQFNIPATSRTDIPRSGKYLISSSAEPYKFGWFLVRAVSFDASIFA